MMNNSPRPQIKDEDEKTRILSLVEPLVNKPNHLSSSWLQEHRWAAIPVPDTINDMDAEWIADAANELGYSEGLAVLTELNQIPDIYEVRFSQQDLLLLESELSLRNYVLIPKDLKFAILKEDSYYFIVAGPKNFVREAVGCSFSTARTMFVKYADDKFWPDKTREILLDIAKRYEPFDGI